MSQVADLLVTCAGGLQSPGALSSPLQNKVGLYGSAENDCGPVAIACSLSRDQAFPGGTHRLGGSGSTQGRPHGARSPSRLDLLAVCNTSGVVGVGVLWGTC